MEKVRSDIEDTEHQGKSEGGQREIRPLKQNQIDLEMMTKVYSIY